MSEDHPARRAGLLSQRYVADGERAKWLDLFADDGVIQDPVGTSRLDPTGKGPPGKVAIPAFWGNVIAKGQVSFDYPKSSAAGDECACTGAVINTLPGGKQVPAPGVLVSPAHQ